MTIHTDMATFKKRVQKIAADNNDYIVDTRELYIEEDCDSITFPTSAEGRGTFHIDQHTHRQIGQRLKLRADYYDRMKAEAPELFQETLHTWMRQGAERRMVRTNQNRARAFLSDSYKRIDHMDMLNCIIPMFEERDDLEIKALALTEKRMHIKLTMPSLKGEVEVGDVCEAGVAADNSEVGQGAWRVFPYVNRLICKNGMKIADKGLSAYHVGRKHEHIEALLTDQTKRAEDAVLVAKTRDVVNACFDEVQFAALLDHMREAAGEAIPNPIKAVELLTNKYALSDDESEAVQNNLIAGGNTSRWGLINAVTRTAQDVDSYDRTDELETLGGKLLDLSSSQWNEIAVAA